jgi:hypothetical protein
LIGLEGVDTDETEVADLDAVSRDVPPAAVGMFV